MTELKPKEVATFFRAAEKNDVTALRKLLDAGAPVDVRDENRMTPLMRAAATGSVDAFRVLVDAGADLDATALCQIDVLEQAAGGGSVEIVRYLLKRGAPVEGHWKPRSKHAEREGNMTPLILAAAEGHVEVIRLLLEAGANPRAKFSGDTALSMAKASIKTAQFDGDVELEARYRAVVALLEGKDAGKAAEAPGHEAAAGEVARFAEQARQPAYQELLQLLTERCGKPRRWKPAPDHGVAAEGVYAFTLRGATQRDLDALRADADTRRCHLILTEPWVLGETARLALFPTAEKFAVLTALGTEGWNYGLETPDILAWLAELDRENPFVLRYGSHDLVGGTFLHPVKGVKPLAERMAEFCPPCLGDGCETPEELARELRHSGSFLLRWD